MVGVAEVHMEVMKVMIYGESLNYHQFNTIRIIAVLKDWPEQL